MSMYFICAIEARVGRPKVEDSLIYTKSRREANKIPSDPDREIQVSIFALLKSIAISNNNDTTFISLMWADSF